MTQPQRWPAGRGLGRRAPAEAATRVVPRIGFWTAALHLGALWALAFAQPLFGLLSDSPQFFVARGNTGSDIVGFALAYGLLPPLVAALVVALAGRVTARLGRAIHLTLIALLVAALFLPPLGDALSGSTAALAPAALTGVGAAVLYARAPVARMFLTALSPTPVVCLAMFLVFSPVSELLRADDASGGVTGPARSTTPIVHVILDELPLATLERPDRGFESKLFPRLARFARGATWYRNATTVADSTLEAVPAQLTGEQPEIGALPTTRDHPRSLFTLFSRSHDMTVVEPLTDLCPRRLCVESRPRAQVRLEALAGDLRVVAEHLLLPDDLAEGLPAIDQTWADFGRDGELSSAASTAPGPSRQELMADLKQRLRENDASAGFRRVTRALARASDGPRPPLLFIHSTLPHAPWRYLPDGRVYALGDGYPRVGAPDEQRQWLLDQSFQRHIVQLRYVDAMIGRLLGALRASGLYDRAVVVVTADHGANFRPGEPRRALTAGNLPDIALVPFIVKWPGQQEGSVSVRAARTLDVLPTIAKAAGVRVPWTTDGMPADERPADGQVEVARASGAKQSQSLARVKAVRSERDAHEARLLAHGLYAIGPRSELIGTGLENVAPATAHVSATIDGASQYRHIAAGAPLVPAFVSGQIRGVAAGTVVAIAVDGRIRATARVIRDRGRLVYGALVPPAALRPGRRRVTVLALSGGGLREIARAG